MLKNILRLKTLSGLNKKSSIILSTPLNALILAQMKSYIAITLDMQKRNLIWRWNVKPITLKGNFLII